MKILYIHQYFKTPDEGGAIRSFYLATGLVSNNFEVELITSHNSPRYEIKQIHGIKVHYLPVPYSNEMNFYTRIRSFIKFFIQSILLSIKIKDIDICYATSTPLTVGCISLFIKKWKNIPYIFEVRDLWPEAPIQMGIIKNKFVIFFLKWLEIKIYKDAKAIIALSPGIKSNIEKKVSNADIYMIPNMADIDFFSKSINITDDAVNDHPFIISYLGAIGKANNIFSLIDIAIEAKKQNQKVEFKIMGAGAYYSEIKNMIRLHKLNNVTIYHLINKDTLQKILKTSDASYISYENFPVLETSSPNKFFDSLAAGKLIILNIKGWLYDLVIRNSCGIFIDPKSPEDFVSKISPFLKDRNLLNTYKINSLKLAEEKFSKDAQVNKLVNLLKTLL